MKVNIDSDVFAMFLKQPNLNVNANDRRGYHTIRQGWYDNSSTENLSLLLQHKDITFSIVKENVEKIKGQLTFGTENERKRKQEYLDILYKYVKTVESGNKWNHKMYDKNNESNNDIINSVNEENKKKNKNKKNDKINTNIKNMNDWKYKELWQNIVLEAFNVTNNKELPDLWLHFLIKFCNINTLSVIKLCTFWFFFF